MSVTYEEQRTETQRLYDEDVLERVRRGIALLQKRFGDEWVERIDMGTLALADSAACVLGQVYKDESCCCGSGDDADGYNKGCCDLLEGREGIAEGFCAEDEEWAELQAAWEDALTPRVEALRR